MKVCKFIAGFIFAMSTVLMLVVLGSFMDMELIPFLLYFFGCAIGMVGGWFFHNYWELQIRRRNRNSHKKIVAEISQLDRDLIEFRRIV